MTNDILSFKVLKSLPDAEKVTPDNQSEELQAVSL